MVGESIAESKCRRMVPLNLQNRSLTVRGRIRVVRDEVENCLEVQVLEALE